MSKGVNKVIIVGNIGGDPEINNLPSGGAVTNVSVATSESWKDKTTGQKQERTEWHKVVFYNRLGEIAGQYLRKGSKVYVEGSLRTKKFQDKQTGQDRFSTEIVAREMQMLDSRGDSQQQPDNQQQQLQQRQHPHQAMQQPQHAQQQPIGSTAMHQQSHYAQQSQSARQPQQQPQQPQGDQQFDDDIPF